MPPDLAEIRAWLEKADRPCSRLDLAFADLTPRVAPLTTFAVRFRYPGPGDPSIEEVQQALGVVEETWQFVLARLPAGAWH